MAEHRPRVGYLPGGPNAEQLRMWLLQLGADPVALPSQGEAGVPLAPQGISVQRAEVAAFVHDLTGVGSRWEHFDDHGSADCWPRGSF